MINTIEKFEDREKNVQIIFFNLNMKNYLTVTDDKIIQKNVKRPYLFTDVKSRCKVKVIVIEEKCREKSLIKSEVERYKQREYQRKIWHLQQICIMLLCIERTCTEPGVNIVNLTN